MEPPSIRMGISVSLSGHYGMFGRQSLEGLRCFVRDRNAAGGVRNPTTGSLAPLVLRIEDDESDERCARRNTEKLVGDRIDLLIGPYGSALTLAAAEIAERHEHVLWNHGGSSDEIFERGYRWVVGISSPASRYLVPILDCIRAVDEGARKVAVLAAKTGFASRVASGVLQRVDSDGLTLTAARSYSTGIGDFRALLEELDDDPPDILLGVGRFEDDLALARQLAERRPPIKAVGLVAAGVSEFVKQLGGAAEGFFGPTQWEPQARYAVDYGPSTDDFLVSYSRATNEPSDYPAAQGYAAGLVAARCVEEAGTIRQDALRTTANRMRFSMFYGPFAIDALSGKQTAHPILVTQWQSGAKKIVWPTGLATGRARYPGRRDGGVAGS
jgi:branched-chain amino acid transport system substrate-binding protein